MNQFREDLEAAVKEQNFERAGELKTTIAQLDAEKNQLLEASEPVREEVRTEKVSLEHCLLGISVTYEMLSGMMQLFEWAQK